MLRFLFEVVAAVLARDHGLVETRLPFATDSPCFARVDAAGHLDTFAIQVHVDTEGRTFVFGEDLIALCAHYGLDATTVFEDVRRQGGRLL